MDAHREQWVKWGLAISRAYENRLRALASPETKRWSSLLREQGRSDATAPTWLEPLFRSWYGEIDRLIELATPYQPAVPAAGPAVDHLNSADPEQNISSFITPHPASRTVRTDDRRTIHPVTPAPVMPQRQQRGASFTAPVALEDISPPVSPPVNAADIAPFSRPAFPASFGNKQDDAVFPDPASAAGGEQPEKERNRITTSAPVRQPVAGAESVHRQAAAGEENSATSIYSDHEAPPPPLSGGTPFGSTEGAVTADDRRLPELPRFRTVGKLTDFSSWLNDHPATQPLPPTPPVRDVPPSPSSRQWPPTSPVTRPSSPLPASETPAADRLPPPTLISQEPAAGPEPFPQDSAADGPDPEMLLDEMIGILTERLNFEYKRHYG